MKMDHDIERALRDAAATLLPDRLLRAAEAWRNWRALTILLTAAALFVLIAGTAAAGAGSGQFLLFMVGSLLGLVVLLTGGSAAGVLLMDQARGLAPRPLGSALADGAACALRYAVLAFAALVTVALYALLAAMLLLLARVPGLGALFYLVLFPLLALSSAALFAFGYFVFLLLGPALWSGATLQQAVARVHALCVQKPLQTALACMLLTLLGAVLALLVSGATTAGTVFISGLSVPILGEADDFGAVLAPPGQRLTSTMNALGWAGLVGSGIAYAVAGAVVSAVLILGLCQLWLHLAADVDFETAERLLDDRLKSMRDSGEDADLPPSAAAAPPAAARHGARCCPACNATIAAGDRYCGDCGRRLDTAAAP